MVRENETETETYEDLDEEEVDDRWEEWWETAVELWEERVHQHLEDKKVTLATNYGEKPRTDVEICFETREE